MKDKKVHNNGYIFVIFANFVLYLFFLSKYIKDETVSLIKVVPLYILIFTLLIIVYLFIKAVQNRKKQLFLSLGIFAVQFGLGLLLTFLWFEPRSEYVLSHPVWLTHLKILASLHYTSGFLILFKSCFKTL